MSPLARRCFAGRLPARRRFPLQTLSPGDPRPRQLLDDWVERASQRQRLRGLVRLAVDRNDGSVRLPGKHLVVLERPSRLRVEILGFLNQSLAVIVTDGVGFEVYRAEDQSYEAGEVDERLLWNEAGIDLSPEEAVAVLLGVPISEPIPAPANAVRDGDGRVRVDLADAQGTVVQRATFDPDWTSSRVRGSRRFGCRPLDRAIWRVSRCRRVTLCAFDRPRRPLGKDARGDLVSQRGTESRLWRPDCFACFHPERAIRRVRARMADELERVVEPTP